MRNILEIKDCNLLKMRKIYELHVDLKICLSISSQIHYCSFVQQPAYSMTLNLTDRLLS